MSADTIEPCIVHMSDYDHDCEACKAEVKALEFQVRTNAEANAVIERRLHSLGQPVQMGNVITIRLNTLIEAMCMNNPKTRSKFERNFMLNYAAALIEADKEAVRARLTGGMKIRPGG